MKNMASSFYSKNYIFLILPLLLFSGFFYYLSFIDLPNGDFYIPNDEFMIPDSGVFMWYGLPSRCMEWPATPTQFFYYILIAIFTVFNFLNNLINGVNGTDFFDLFDKQVYDFLLNKPKYLVYGRVFQYVCVMIVSVLTFLNLEKSQLLAKVKWAGPLFFLLIFTSHTLINTTSIVRPDAIAIALAAYFVSLIIATDLAKIKSILMVISVFALLLSFRTIYLFLLPIVLYIIFKKSQTTFNIKLALLLFMLVLVLALNPAILGFSFGFMKSFLGNIVGKRQNTMGTYYNLNFIKEQFLQNKAIPIFIVFAFLGVWRFFRIDKNLKWLFIILIVSILMYLQSVLTSPTLFTTHLAPILPFFLFFVAIGFSFLIKNRIQLYVLFGVLFIFNFYVNGSLTRSSMKMNYFEASNWLKTNAIPYNSLAVPEQLDVLFANIRNKESFKTEFELLNNESKRARKLNSLYKLKNEKFTSNQNMLLRNFMFDEENIKSAAAFICMQQTADNQVNKKNVFLFDDNISADTTGISPLQCFKFNELKPLFVENKIEYILTKNNLESLDFKLIKKFDKGLGEHYFVFAKTFSKK